MKTEETGYRKITFDCDGPDCAARDQGYVAFNDGATLPTGWMECFPEETYEGRVYHFHTSECLQRWIEEQRGE